MRTLSLATAALLLVLGLLGTAIAANDGGTMARLMGQEAYIAMVDQMRAVLGNERADAMIASCEGAMAANGSSMVPGAMQQMMSGRGAMMGGR